MIHKKISSLLGLVFLIIIGVTLTRLFEDLTGVEAHGPAMVQVPTHNVPIDFDWETYVQNYEDLQRAGIDTEKKAKQHWMEFGKSEGRDYHALHQVRLDTADKLPEPVTESPIKAAPRVSIDSPNFDPVTFREQYNKVLKRAGIETREEAVEFSLAFWEKRREAYAVRPLATSRSIPRVSLDPPKFDPVNLRKKYDKVLQGAGVKTKEEAMKFSLAFWEKKRRLYFS